MRTVSYLRVSTDTQDLEKNQAEILRFANEERLVPVEWVEEKISGQIPWRKRKIAQVIDTLQPGDNLIVSELSRLGRSLLEIMEMLSVCTGKKVNVFSIKGNWKLDSSIQSKLIAMCFAMASEIERDLIAQRTREALAAKKRAGFQLGRPKGPGKSKLDQYRPEIEALLKNGSTQRFIAKRYGSTEANLANWIKRHGLKKEEN
jgi:DNA invertase Pin-like site-specific DNA recombinase